MTLDSTATTPTLDWTDRAQVAKAIQYTNVNPDLTRDGVLAHLATCAEYGFDAAMIAPVWASLGKEVLAGTGVRVATTLNFPMANDTLGMKLAALRELAKTGADEFDFPPNPGYLVGGQVAEYAEELQTIVRVAHEEGLVVKAMLEFGFLNEEQKVTATRIAYEAGIDWVKQSSGWGKGGLAATVEDVRILTANIEPPCRVKVSGKVNSLEKMQELFAAGAELVGTSSGPAIVDGLTGTPMPTEARPRVTVLGSYAKAIVITAERIPLAGETLVGHDYRQEFGGKGSDMAVQAARLGAEVAFVGVVGDDALGREFLDLMAAEGVDTSAVRVTAERTTGVGLIVKDEAGRNLIVVDLAANGLFGEADVAAAGALVTGTPVVLAQLEIPLATALHGLRVAHDAGATTVLNPAPAVRLDGQRLDMVDVLTPNQTEARLLVGRDPDADVDNAVIAQELHALGVPNVVITRGEDGADVFTQDGSTTVPAHPVAVVDSNGAGDAFSAALAVGLAEGRPLPEAVRLANAAAALCCEAWETVPSYRDRAAVEALLARTEVPA